MTAPGAVAGAHGGPQPEFAAALLGWHARHGRRGLPWQPAAPGLPAQVDPYRVWLSEIMLQQTQVTVVVPYFERFVARFPDVRALAAAPAAEVLALWSGLGYYARARNLHAAARLLVERHHGQFPASAQILATLPGIGRSTAGAIAAFCFGERVPILDGNVRRILTRHDGIDGDPASAPVVRQLWSRAASLLPRDAADMPAYTQAIMDLGATLCVRRAPRCEACPVHSSCVARREQRVAQLPGPRTGKRRAVRVRRVFWLLLLHDGRVLLEQRPPAGIWGGLLAPPEFDTLAGLRSALHQLARGARASALAPRRIAFTHFTLDSRPHLVLTGKAAPMSTLAAVAEESGRRWLELDAADSAPLPASVKVLLEELRERAPS